MNKRSYEIFALYFFLLAGGLWHVLDVLQPVMRATAGFVVIFLAVWIAFHYWSEHKESTKKEWSSYFIVWMAIVVVSTFLIEYAGVSTGKVFGRYEYGRTLQPQLLEVPLSIGFAWLGMLLSSAAIVQKLAGTRNMSHLANAAGIAFFMVLFDIVMEPAAVALGYWNWFNQPIPIQNYAAWFAIGFVLAFIGLRFGVLTKRLPMLAIHIYSAQLLYFGMILLK
ncbi:MAG: carotenoid biosynthesis protein [Calditrichia bacterium]